MDPSVRKRILQWAMTNLDGTENPHIHGHALTGPLAGLWTYHIGDYRLVCKIHENELLVVGVDTCHRSEIYKRLG